MSGEPRHLIPVSTHSPYLSHRRFVAGFLTWTTEWRGQPGGDPRLQLWLLPPQPPDITNHTPAGGETEEVWQLFAQDAGEERMEGVENGEDDKKQNTSKQTENIQGEKDNRFNFWEMWRAQWSVLYDQSYGWSSVLLFTNHLERCNTMNLLFGKSSFLCIVNGVTPFVFQ